MNFRSSLSIVASTPQMPSTSEWTSDLDLLRLLNCNRVQCAEGQRKDPWLGPLINFLAQDCSLDALSQVDQRVKKWVLAIHKRASVIDGILYYSDEFMQDPTHMRIFVPSESAMQRHLLQAYRDSPLGMHRDATQRVIRFLVTFIGAICQNMYTIGFVVVHNAFASKLCSSLMVLCKFAFTNIRFIH